MKKKDQKPPEPASDERNEYYENLLRIQATDPKRFASLSQSLKRAVGYYERARERAIVKELEKRAA